MIKLLTRFFNSTRVFSFVIFLAKVLPKEVMMVLARIFIWVLMRTGYQGIEAIQSNLSVIYGREFDKKEKKKLVKDVFMNQAHYLYDVFHSYSHPKKVLRKVHISDEDRAKAEAFIAAKEGAVIVGPHFGNFDICLIAIGLLGIEAQVLSIANPNAEYQMQNDIRQVDHLEVTPISVKSLIAANRRLKSGGIVVTGVDRPLPESEASYNFFGKPAKLPDGHVRLALKQDVPVFILYSKTNGNDYQLMISDPIKMEVKESKEASIHYNTEKILSLLEEIIQSDPKNWMMFYPVWNE